MTHPLSIESGCALLCAQGACGARCAECGARAQVCGGVGVGRVRGYWRVFRERGIKGNRVAGLAGESAEVRAVAWCAECGRWGASSRAICGSGGVARF